MEGSPTLVSVNNLPEKYRQLFPKFRYFNRIQSEIYPLIFDSDNSIVVSAPTSSGKTVLFELAIIKYLSDIDNSGQTYESARIVLVAPMKAICNERYRDWSARFAVLSLKILLLTGTTETKSSLDLSIYNIIITTPEKWDSTMRQWHIYKDVIRSVDLFMIDEVQLVGDKSRGPTLEAIVSRMKTMRPMANSLRIIAATATASNLADVAKWLETKGRPCEHRSFGQNTRPVPLKMIVNGYIANQAYFKFDISLNYKLNSLILEHADNKPSLIFCSTRNSVEMSAKELAKSITTRLSLDVREFLYNRSLQISHPQAKDLIKQGIGIHHAGILENELQLIEDAFRQEKLPVLVTTTTLAMGVNLPAHLVIIKGTKMYASGEWASYSDSQIQQMIGRAGRPQFDTSAVAIIMTTKEDKCHFEQMISRTTPLESGLHLHLTEHLNSEIALGTLSDLALCMEWLSTTFLYVRAVKNPRYYGIPLGLSENDVISKLILYCQIDINKLTSAGMVAMDENASLSTTFLGDLMARHYLQFETVRNLSLIRGSESMSDLLHLVSRSNEFEGLHLRVCEKKVLNQLNADKIEAIRYPMSGKIKSLEMKINCLIQAVLGCLQITNHGLIVESEKILKSADAVAKCMSEYLLKGKDKFKALYSALLLSKCLKAKLWENSQYVSRQLPGIGIKRARLLAGIGKNNFESLAIAGPNSLNSVLRCNIGENIIHLASKIPQYEMIVKRNADPSTILVDIRLTNKDELYECVVDPNSHMVLLVGNLTTNCVLFQDRFTHYFMLDIDSYKRNIFVAKSPGYDQVNISAYFFSTTWVGFDVEAEITLQFNPSPKSPEISPRTKAKQRITDYFAKVLESESPSTSNEFIHNSQIASTSTKQVEVVQKRPAATSKQIRRKSLITISDIIDHITPNSCSAKQNLNACFGDRRNENTKNIDMPSNVVEANEMQPIQPSCSSNIGITNSRAEIRANFGSEKRTRRIFNKKIEISDILDPSFVTTVSGMQMNEIANLQSHQVANAPQEETILRKLPYAKWNMPMDVPPTLKRGTVISNVGGESHSNKVNVPTKDKPVVPPAKIFSIFDENPPEENIIPGNENVDVVTPDSARHDKIVTDPNIDKYIDIICNNATNISDSEWRKRWKSKIFDKDTTPATTSLKNKDVGLTISNQQSINNAISTRQSKKNNKFQTGEIDSYLVSVDTNKVSMKSPNQFNYVDYSNAITDQFDSFAENTNIECEDPRGQHPRNLIWNEDSIITLPAKQNSCKNNFNTAITGNYRDHKNMDNTEHFGPPQPQNNSFCVMNMADKYWNNSSDQLSGGHNFETENMSYGAGPSHGHYFLNENNKNQPIKKVGAEHCIKNMPSSSNKNSVTKEQKIFSIFDTPSGTDNFSSIYTKPSTSQRSVMLPDRSNVAFAPSQDIIPDVPKRRKIELEEYNNDENVNRQTKIFSIFDTPSETAKSHATNQQSNSLHNSERINVSSKCQNISHDNISTPFHSMFKRLNKDNNNNTTNMFSTFDTYPEKEKNRMGSQKPILFHKQEQFLEAPPSNCRNDGIPYNNAIGKQASNSLWSSTQRIETEEPSTSAKIDRLSDNFILNANDLYKQNIDFNRKQPRYNESKFNELISGNLKRSWNDNNEIPVPQSPKVYTLEKKRKVHKMRPSNSFVYKMESMTQKVKMTLTNAGPSNKPVCDTLIKTRKSLMWCTPLVTEKEFTPDTGSENSSND